MGEPTESCWPEQDAVLAWWMAHRTELKEAVSKYRIAEQRKAEARIKQLEEEVRAFLKWGEEGGCYTSSDIAMFQRGFERALAGKSPK